MKDQALGRMKQGVMNKTEEEYANYLEGQKQIGNVLWYRFEGIKFRLGDNVHYNPDFAVMRSDNKMEIHEVKGSLTFIRDDAKVKIKVAAEMFPFKFYLVAPKKKVKPREWDFLYVGNKERGGN